MIYEVDKLNHFFYATIMAFVLINLFKNKGLIISIVIIVSKELIYDGLLNLGDVEFLDFIYGLIPIIMIYTTTKKFKTKKQ